MELEPLDFDPFPTAGAAAAPKPAPALEPIDFDPFPVMASQPEPKGWYESTAQTARDSISKSAVGRGFTAGLLQENPDNLGNAVEGFGYLSGSTWAIDQGKSIQDWAKTAGGVSKQGTGILDSDSLDSFLTNVGETFGSGLASTVPSVVAGVGGAAAGGAVGSAAGPVGAGVGAVAGGAAGAGSASYVQSFGELYGALKEAGVDPQRAAELSRYGAIPIASLDMIGLGAMAKPFIGEARREVVHGLARRIATEAAKGATAEGITEAAQEFLKDATVTYETGRPLFTAERAKGWAEAGIGGALVGGAVDAGAGFRRPEPRRDPNAPDPNLPPPKPGDIESPIPTADIQRGRAMMDALIEGRMEEALGLGRPGQAPAPSTPGPQPTEPSPGSPPHGYEPMFDDENSDLQVGWFNPRTGDVRGLNMGASNEGTAAAPEPVPAAEAATPLERPAPGDQAAPVSEGLKTNSSSSVAPEDEFGQMLPGRPTAADVRRIGVGGTATGGMVQPTVGKVVQVRRDDGRTTAGTVVGIRQDGKIEVKGDLGGKVAVAPEAIVEPEAPAPVAAPAATPETMDRVTGFRTAKGSTYTIDESGRTVRDKAARNDPGHEGDSGVKPVTARTVYLDVDASQLSAAGLTLNVPEKGARVAFRADGKAALLTWNPKANQWGKSSSWLDVRNEPAVGRYPLELWKPVDDVPGYEAYGRMHAGNKIVEIFSGNRQDGVAPTASVSTTPKPQNSATDRAPEAPAGTTPQPPETKIERAKRRGREMIAEGKTVGDIQRALRAEGASNVEVTAATREAVKAMTGIEAEKNAQKPTQKPNIASSPSAPQPSPEPTPASPPVENVRKLEEAAAPAPAYVSHGPAVPFIAPRGREAANEAAKAHVLKAGRASGAEHILVIAPSGEAMANGAGTRSNSGWSPFLDGLLADRALEATVHHNHPAGTPISGSDIYKMARHWGIATIWAHGHNGRSTSAAFTPRFMRVLEKLSPQDREVITSNLWYTSLLSLQKTSKDRVSRGETTHDEINADHKFHQAIIIAMERAGVIVYTDTVDRAPTEKLFGEQIGKAVEHILASPSLRAWNDRRAEPVRSQGGVAPVPSGVAPDAADAGSGDNARPGERADSGDIAPATLANAPAKKPKPSPMLARIENYFRPGRIIRGYGASQDRVEAFRVIDRSSGRWQVDVIEVGANGAPISEARVRTHSTTPAESDLRKWERDNPVEAKAQPAQAKRDPAYDQVVADFADRIYRSEKFNILRARKIAADYGMTDRKAVEEAFEAAIVQTSRKIVAEGGGAEQIYRRLVTIYENQPRLAERTSDSVERQAYSTPAPLAFLASHLARINAETRVYEPSAGNGMLLIGATKGVANEIDSARIANIRAAVPAGIEVHQGDATTFAPAGAFDVVIANPPFGKVKNDDRSNRLFDVDGLKTTEIDHAISWKALEAMKADGRAVLIIGGNQGTDQERVLQYRSDRPRLFFNSLYSTYNVVDHFTVDGKLYERQGAGWPVDVIVIDGKGKSALPLPMRQAPPVLTTWDAVGEKLNDRVDAAGQRGPDRVGEATVPAAQSPDAGRVPVGAGGQDRPAGRPGGSPSGDRTPAKVRGDGGAVDPGTKAPAVGGGTAGGKQRVAPGAGSVPAEPGPAASGPGRTGDGSVSGAGDAGGVPDSAVPGARGGDVAAAFDTVFDEIFGAPEPAQATAPPAARSPRPAKPRPAREAAVSAVKNTAMSLDDMTAGLSALFGGNKLSSGPTFDEETYAKAKPFFQAALVHFKTAGRDVVDVMRALMRHLVDVAKFTREMIVGMRPYIERFVSEQANSTEDRADATVTEPKAEAAKRAENTEAETSFQVRYEPTSKASFAVGTLVPRNMQTAMRRALDDLSGRVGDIDDYVAEKLGYRRSQMLGGPNGEPGYFSAEQIDALALAIDNVEGGAGFIVGDQTGVGKGRFVAAMLRYGMKAGRIPVFITKDPGLYGDMVRDLRDIGMPEIAGRILVTNNDLRGDKAIPLSQEDSSDVLSSMAPAQQKAAVRHLITNGSLPDGFDMVFTTYSQVQYGPKGVQIDRQTAMLAIAPNAMVVLDESHEAGGSESRRVSDDGTVIPTRADFVRSVLRDAKGVVYSSATYAKNPFVMSLYFKTDLSQAITDPEKLTETITKGGVPLQQVIANMLVEAGQYARRERSFEGVEIQMDQLPTDQAMANRASATLRAIFTVDTDFMTEVRDSYIEELSKEGGKGGKDGAIGESSASGTGFAQVMHNVVAQMLLSVKAPGVVDKAIALAKNGEKPIIALSNTNAAILEDYIEEEGLKTGQRADITFNTILERYLRRLRRITVKDARNVKSHIYLTDADIEAHGGAEALAEYRRIEKMVREVDLRGMPASPIDFILDRLNAAGIKADEITGRGRVLKNGIIAERKATPAAKKQVMNAYNSGAVDALVINRSGSTGFSMHATGKRGNDGKQRHMILLQPDANIDVFMQMLGRIHRTGQIKLPRYTLGVSDLAVEKRSAAVLMRKMASLNANTTASKRSAVSLDATDFMNRYGDDVVADFLRDNPEIANLTDTRAGENNTGLAAKFTGRLAILPSDQVAEVYQQIEAAYNEYMENLDRLGLNTLEAKTLDLDARTISKSEIVPGHGDGPFGAPAYVETVDVRRIGKAMTWQEATEAVKSALAGRNAQSVATEQIKTLRGLLPGFMKRIKEGKARATRAGTEAKTEKQRQKAASALASWERATEETESRLAQVERLIEHLQAGKTFLLEINENQERSSAGRYGDEDAAGGGSDAPANVLPAVSMGINIKKVRENPAAASQIIARFALADASREITVPLSKFLGDAPLYRAMEDNSGSVKAAFEAGGQEARETRQIITGNLVSGFSQFGKGQIAIFLDSEGNRRQGVILPRKFDAEAELARLPVRFENGTQIQKFLAEGNGLRMVKSEDGILLITGDKYGFKAAVSTKGGKPYYLLRPVRDLIGDFSQRRGNKVFEANIPTRQLAGVIQAYMDNLGTAFITTGHKTEARAVLEEIPAGPADSSRQFSLAPAGWGEVEAMPVPKLSSAEVDEVAAIIRRVAGLDGVRTEDTIPIPANSPGAKAWGRTEAGRASAYYSGVSDTVTIALDMPEGAGRRVAYHEAFHRLQRLYLTKKEQAVLLAESDKLRAIVAESMSRGRAVADRMAQSEVEAEAFSLYTVAKERADGSITSFPLRARAVFAKLDRIVRAVRNWLNGRGFQTYEDVFGRAAEGRTALRTARGITGTTVMDDFSMIDDDQLGETEDMDFGAARRSMGEALFTRNASLLQRVRAATDWDAVSETIDRWRYAVQDIVIDLKQVQREIVDVLGPLAESQNPYLAYELSESRAGPRLEALHEDMVSPMLARMKAAGISIEDLDEYLYAKHAPERNARIAEINPRIPEGGSGMTDEEADSIVDRVESGPKARDYARLAGMVYDINGFALQTRLDAGLLSEEQAEAWRQSYEFYVPLRGFAEMDPEAFEDRPNLGGSGVNVRGKESQRALGRESRAADITAHAIMQAQEAIARAERNKVGQALYELATAAPNKDFWRADPVKTKAVWNKKLQQVVYQRVHALSRVEEDHTVFLKINGKEHRVSFNVQNPRARRLAEGMRRLKGKDWGPVVRTFGMINRYLSTVNTTLSPEFIITNAFKDLQTAMVNIGQHDVEGIRKRTLKHFVSVWKGLIRLKSPQQRDEWRGWYEEFIASGGRTYWNDVESVQEIAKRLEAEINPSTGLGARSWRGVKSVFKVIETANNNVENAIRLAAFRAAREGGMSPAQAASLAKNLTVNFNRRGAYGPVINMLYLFYNAGVQGTAALLGAMRHPAVRRAVGYVIVAGAVITLFNSLAGDDDEDGESFYAKIPDSEKQRNLIIMIPGSGGKNVKFPIGWGVNAFYGLGRASMEAAFGRKPLDAAADVMTGFIDAFNPIGGAQNLLKMISPTITDPIVELAMNRDFADRPIAPEKKSFGAEVPNAQRFWNSVGPGWRMVTDFLTTISGGDKVRPGAIDLSPEWLEYLFGVATGSAGQFVGRTVNGAFKMADPTSDWSVNDVPFARRVLGSKAPWVDKAAFYERLHDVEQQKAYLKRYAESGDTAGRDAVLAESRDKLGLEKAAHASQKVMADIRKARDAAWKQKDQGRIDDAEYRDRIKALKEREQEIVTRFNRIWMERIENARP